MAARRSIKMASSEKTTSSQESDAPYAKQPSRIIKENLYMVIALWMEKFPVERVEADPFKRVGAVLVLPNDMIYAVDCTRNGVHGVARLLMAHQDNLQDCQVFVSRKPCSLCTKLLIQSKVKRIFYLPIEPEYKRQKQDNETEDDVLKKFENETSCVDNLFKVSAIAQTVFVPKVEQEVLANLENKNQTAENKTQTSAKMEKTKAKYLKTYWNKEWMKDARVKLPWPAFDKKMKKQIKANFKDIFEWMAGTLIESKKGSSFEAVFRRESMEMPFDPEGSKFDRKQANHLLTLANFLAKRTDDPRKGVGAVVINKEKEIVALGWNGFPTKALFGEFPRASERDKTVDEKKYPYIIHAEQNALLLRNTKNIAGGTLLVTKTPCHDCTPLLEMQRIKTVVVGENLEKGSRQSLDYSKFCVKVERGVFICFERKNARISGGDEEKAGDEISGEPGPEMEGAGNSSVELGEPSAKKRKRDEPHVRRQLSLPREGSEDSEDNVSRPGEEQESLLSTEHHEPPHPK